VGLDDGAGKLMIQIPLFNAQTPRWTEKVILDGVRYALGFNWNTREQAWYVDLADGSGNPICMGIKVIPSIPLWSHFKGAGGFPPGDLILVDTLSNPATASIGYSDLGQRFSLLYIGLADIQGAA
jgi:hypothetical protein